MDYKETYSKILADLKDDKRPLLKLSKEDLNYLKVEWEDFFKEYTLNSSSLALSNINKIICILDHTQSHSTIFGPIIIKTLNNISDVETIIFTLGVATKHIILKNFKEGTPPSAEFIQILESLLEHSNPEVLEWTLRTIDQLGAMSIRLRPKILEQRPSLLAIFNTHKKASRQIIQMLEKRWESMLAKK